MCVSPMANPGAGWTRAARSRPLGFGQRPISGKDWSGRSPGTSQRDTTRRLYTARERRQVGVEILMLHPISGVERLVHRTDARGEMERFTHRATESPLEVVQGDAAD